MKITGTTLFFTLLAGLIVPTIGFATELHGTTTTVCSKEKQKCATVSAKETVTSKFGQIFVLINPEVTIEENGKTVQKISGDRGTLDFVANQVVIAQISTKEIREIAISLATLEKKEFRTLK